MHTHDTNLGFHQYKQKLACHVTKARQCKKFNLGSLLAAINSTGVSS